jgi:hypothetical protein
VWSAPYVARSNGWQEQGALDVKVAAMEDVTVPAGTFKALKLEIRFSTGNQEVIKNAGSCSLTSENARVTKLTDMTHQ